MNTMKSSQVYVKFLYSYGGRILPRRSDGNLRYVGGFTRVLSVDRSTSFTELMVKFGDLCGTSMSLKCKLPDEDLDVLVSITCDEDLMNVIQEYDRAFTVTNKEMKIRAVLFPLKSANKISPPSSPMSCFDFPATTPEKKAGGFRSPPYAAAEAAAGGRCYHGVYGYPAGARRFYCCERGSPRHLYEIVANRY